MFQWE